MGEGETIRAIDLCCGAGGWACAARGLPIQITHAFDRWPEAAKTYEINHPGTRVVVGDLCQAEIEAQIRTLAGEVDLVLGGIPCESVSVYRNGWNRRNRTGKEEMAAWRGLLDQCLALVRDLKPRWWCIEDVRGIVNELPVLTPWVELNAGAWSAQARRRVFVGEFPVPALGNCGKVLGDHLRPGPYRVGARLWGRMATSSGQFTADRCRAWYPNRKGLTVAQFLDSRRDSEVGIMDPRLPGGKRQLEWQEGALLQGFPQDYLFYGSPTAVAKMIGQAVQIDLGRAILEGICRESGGA